MCKVIECQLCMRFQLLSPSMVLNHWRQITQMLVNDQMTH